MSGLGSRKALPLLGSVLLTICMAGAALGQQQPLPDAPTPQQNVPDTPSATRPTEPAPLPQAPAPASTPPSPGSSSSKTAAPSQPAGTPANPAATDANPEPAPSPSIATVPPNQTSSQGNGTSRDELWTFSKRVNFVIIPVTVKDQSGQLVPGLLPQDFSVLENGTKQKISFFTSDPFPLSAALVVDVGMSDTELRKVQNTLSALGGSFGPFDQVSIYTYSNTVKKVQDLSGANSQAFTEALRKLKQRKGTNAGAPMIGGPLQSGPTVNSKSTDPTSMGPVYMPNYHPESHVLNDAILRAAMDLSKQDCVAPIAGTKVANPANQCPTRRKILFVISTGEERGSANSYDNVMKVLLSNQIAVYAIGVGGSAMPVYGKAAKFHIPGLGYGDILPKYASATGGQVFSEFTQSAIESAYARVTEEARNQYTVGYYAPAGGISNQYRSIEVRVKGSANWKVYAKDGYYPLPAAPPMR